MQAVYAHTKRTDRKGTFGGKADSLFLLLDAGFNVPAFAVIPLEEGLSIIPEKFVLASDFEAAQKTIREYTFDGVFLQELISSFRTRFYAVRSSAPDEDGGEFSFAGQFETELFVTPEKLAEAIKKVWLSAYSDRARQYRLANNISSRHGIAVVIQEMVEAQSSGVAFGINPATGKRNEKVISAVFGLGEGLVSGQMNADNYFVGGKKVITEIAEKKEQLVFNKAAGNGTTYVPIDAADQNKPVLSDRQALEIAAVLEQLKELRRRPQDIEFAYRESLFYLLQSRPVTTVSKIPDQEGKYIVWDNSNIIESYPGITSPLTFSFIRKMYEAVYIRFSGLMGISEKEISANANTYENMLGLLNGRVYYNLRSWYKILSLLPGYSLNTGFMEKMMGVKEKFVLNDYSPRTKFRERLRVLKMIRIIFSSFRALPRMRRKFVSDFERVMKKYNALDFSKLAAWDLMQHYQDFEQTLLKKWKAPLVNDFFTMIFYGSMQKLAVKYKLDEAGTLHNDLLCGARDIVSTEPIHRCYRMAQLINADLRLRQLFMEQDELFIVREIRSGKFPELHDQFNEYINDWGDRTVGELKLETITYRQEPALLVRVLKGFIGQQQQHKDHDLKIRKEAENIVSEKLRKKPIRKWIFSYFLRKSRDLVTNRENLRFARTRGFGLVRRIFIAIGENFYSEGLLSHPRDIFMLKKEEIFDFIQGTSDTPNLRALVTLRKKEYAVFENKMTSERIATHGIVYAGNDFSLQSNELSFPANGKATLKGIGCCPGKIRARVRIVHDPYSLNSLQGDILVTASTDPGWITLFPSASAILVERGSLLSHSAIVSRELGKPCIVGITGLLQKLQTGDLVEMDGSTGEILIIENECAD